MALIKCPECGQSISDKAAACIHCGCPIEKTNYMATFRMPHMPGIIDNPKITITNQSTGEVLAESRLDSVVKFKVASPMTIQIKIGGFGQKRLGAFHGEFDLVPQNNARYAFVISRTPFGWSKPSMMQVDHIDADY